MSVAVSDLAKNVLKPYSWTFGVQEPTCGQADFYSIVKGSVPSVYVVNSYTSLIDNSVNVSAYNPNHKDLSWVENTRIDSIDLMYRKHGAKDWLSALDINGNQAAFYDDVSGA